MTRRAIYARAQLTRCQRRSVNCGSCRRDHQRVVIIRINGRARIRPRRNGHSRSVMI